LIPNDLDQYTAIFCFLIGCNLILRWLTLQVARQTKLVSPLIACCFFADFEVTDRKSTKTSSAVRTEDKAESFLSLSSLRDALPGSSKSPSTPKRPSSSSSSAFVTPPPRGTSSSLPLSSSSSSLPPLSSKEWRSQLKAIVKKWSKKNEAQCPNSVHHSVCPVTSLVEWHRLTREFFENYGTKPVNADVRARAQAVAAKCISVGRRTALVDLVLMDGKGVVLWHILNHLITNKAIDAVRITVVDINIDMVEYHRFAFPQVAHVHTDVFIWLKNQLATPSQWVCYFNFSQLALTSKVLKASQSPESKARQSSLAYYDVPHQLADACEAATHQRTAGTFLSFSAVRGGKDTLDKLKRQLKRFRLTSIKIESGRRNFLTYELQLILSETKGI
jgi:hypothetical protein